MRDWVRYGAAALGGLVVGAVICFLVWGRAPLRPAFKRSYMEGERVRVVKVVDGDTVVLEDGVHVRYRGCDTPETMRFVRDPKPFADKATDRNRELVEGAWVTLRFPPPGKQALDEHGRLLAEVHLDAGDPSAEGEGEAGVSVAGILVREGLARALLFDIGDAARSKLREAEKEAKTTGRGIWGKAPVADAEGAFVASRTGKYAHRPDCVYAKRISPENLLRFGTLKTATATPRGGAKGRELCPTCFDAGGATAKASSARAAPARGAAGPFVASRTGKYAHRPDCIYAKRISPENLLKLETLEAATAKGKERCPTCFDAGRGTAKASSARAAPARGAAGPFVASRTGKYAHRPDCTYAKLISPKNLLKLETLEAAAAKGKERCPTCFDAGGGTAKASSARAAPARGAAGPFVASRSGKYVHRADCVFAKNISAKNLSKHETLKAVTKDGKQICPTCFELGEAATPRGGPYLASRPGRYVHRADCIFAKRISEKNLAKYDKLEAATAAGKDLCPTCFAPKRPEAEEGKPAARKGAGRAPAKAQPGPPFLVSRTGKYVHQPGCMFGARISEKNLVKYESVEAATATGKDLCPTCFAPKEPGAEEGKPAARKAGGRAPAEVRPGPPFVASREGKYVHQHGCMFGARISEKNLVKYESVEAATAKGKKPCPTCFAPKKPPAEGKPNGEEGTPPAGKGAGRAPADVQPGPPFFASRRGKYVHQPGCIYGKRISKENLLKLDTLEAAAAAGKEKCPTCFAPKGTPAKGKPEAEGDLPAGGEPQVEPEPPGADGLDGVDTRPERPR